MPFSTASGNNFSVFALFGTMMAQLSLTLWRNKTVMNYRFVQLEMQIKADYYSAQLDSN